MKYKLIALDIDGTLLNSNSEITPATRRTLRQVYEAGATIVVSTGRRFCTAKPTADKLGIDVLLSCHNGVLLKKLDGELLFHRLLPCEVARTATKYIKRFGAFPIVFQGTQDEADIIVESATPDTSNPPLLMEGVYVKDYIQRNERFVTKVSNLETELSGDVIEVVAMVPLERHNGIVEYLRHHLGNKAKVIPTHGTSLLFLGVANPNVSKATPLRYLAEKMGIERKEVLAIGDNYNDLEMLEFAGLGILMGNANDELKQMGFYVTASNDEDGVAQALEKSLLQDKK